MKHEVLRIEPRSVLRIGFLLGLLGGFVFGLVEVLLFRAMSAAGGEAVLPPGARELIGSGPGALAPGGAARGRSLRPPLRGGHARSALAWHPRASAAGSRPRPWRARSSSRRPAQSPPGSARRYHAGGWRGC